MLGILARGGRDGYGDGYYGEEIPLDNCLRSNLTDPRIAPDAEMLEIVPEELQEEYSDRITFWDEIGEDARARPSYIVLFFTIAVMDSASPSCQPHASGIQRDAEHDVFDLFNH